MSEKEIYRSLKALKELVLNEPEFYKIWDYFFTCFEENPLFNSISKRTKHPHLKQTIKHLCSNFLKRDCQITGLILLKIKNSNFYHSPFRVDHHFGVFFYFDDIDKGMVSLS